MPKELKHRISNELRDQELSEESEDLNIKAKLGTPSFADSMVRRNLIKYYHRLDLIDSSILKLSEHSYLNNLETNLAHIASSTRGELLGTHHAYFNFKPINIKNKEMEGLTYTLVLDTRVNAKSVDVSKETENIIKVALFKIDANMKSLSSYLNIMQEEKLQLSTVIPLHMSYNSHISLDMISKLNLVSTNSLAKDIELQEIRDLFTNVKDKLFLGSLIVQAGLGLGSFTELLEFLFNIEDRGRRTGLPRSFGCLGSDVLVFIVVEKDERSEWFLIVSYVISELLREITQCSRVRVFLRSASTESLYEEESLDSLSPHSLRPLDLKCRVEVFDYRGKTSTHAKEILELLKGRLKTLYSHGPGAIIISLSNREHGEEVWNALTKQGALEIPTKAFILSFDKLENLSTIDFIRALLGINNVKCESINSCMRLYREIINYTVNALSILVRRQISKEGEQIDYWQYPLKVATYAAIIKDFITDILRENKERKTLSRIDLLKLIIEKEIQNKIFVEKSLEECTKDQIPVPDIWFRKNENTTVAIEVESLIGVGDPTKKVDETIEKYEGLSGCVRELWIVVRPIDAILHYRALMDRVKLYRKVLGDKLELPKVFIKVINYIGNPENNRYNVLAWELTDLKEYIARSLGRKVKLPEGLTLSA